MTQPGFARDTAPPPSTGCLPMPLGGRLGASAISLMLVALFMSLSAHAQNSQGVLASEPLIVYDTPMELRRAELRRALTTGADIPVTRRERSRMTPEQRDVLNRELREAMRGAYERRRAETRQGAR